LHEKIVELRSRIVSLEADLKVPIPTFCSTCELHAMKNLDLAKCVGRLKDENDKLREGLSWLSSQEPQLCMMIVLTQKVHLAPNTQQAEQAGFARAESVDDVPVNFFLKINKR
jgi:hypothetical protein